jgi:hypothetical protein
MKPSERMLTIHFSKHIILVTYPRDVNKKAASPAEAEKAFGETVFAAFGARGGGRLRRLARFFAESCQEHISILIVVKSRNIG